MKVYRRTSYKEFVLRATLAESKGHKPRLLKTDFLFLERDRSAEASNFGSSISEEECSLINLATCPCLKCY